MHQSFTSPNQLPLLPKTSRGRHQSLSFRDRLSMEISTADDAYPRMTNAALSQEHTKLKSLLRDFNQQTLSILQGYIEKPKQRYRMPSVHELEKVREREAANNALIIQNMRREIKALEARCEELQGKLTLEELHSRIITKNTEGEQLRLEIKQLSREVTLNGISIERGVPSTIVTELEEERIQVEKKRDELRTHTASIDVDLAGLATNLEKADHQLGSLEPSCLHLEAQQGAQSSLFANYSLKVKTQLFLRSKLDNESKAKQQVYLHRLRILEGAIQAVNSSDNKIKAVQVQVERAQKELHHLQSKLKQLRANQ